MSKIKKSILAAVMSFTAAVMFCAVPSVSGLSTCRIKKTLWIIS